MANTIRGFIKKITGENTPDPLNKQPIPDADAKLTLFKDVTAMTSSAIESYLKSMSKSIDLTLKEKLDECQSEFLKYDAKASESLEASKDILLNNVILTTSHLQDRIAGEINELMRNLEKLVLKPLTDFQKEVGNVKETRRELKDAYARMETCRNSLDKAKRDVEMYKKQIEQLRIANDTKRQQEAYKALVNAEEKTVKYEKELDDARLVVNERYDRYTEGLFKKVSEETELANCFLEYLKLQQKFHKQVYEILDDNIPDIKGLINDYPKKPIFGAPIEEQLRLSNSNDVSPVIRKLIDGMVKQNVFSEEGVFRIAGSKAKMNRLISSINAGYLELIDFSDYDIHCLASVLKQYLRDLPDSIMCNNLYEDWLNAVNSTSKLDAFKQVLKRLPKANYENLKYIVKFLACIIENHERTKMNANNIGICFGVSLLNTTNIDPSRNIDMGTATHAFDYMLLNHVELFPGEINFIPTQKPLTYSHTFAGRTKTVSAVNEGGLVAKLGSAVENISEKPVIQPISRHTDHHPEPSNRYSVMIPDRRYIDSDVTQLQEHKINLNKTNINTPSSSNLGVINESQNGGFVKGHSKKLSADYRLDDSKSPSPSPDVSNSSQAASVSPRLKPKKQAPAPPPPSSSSNLLNSNSSSNILNNSTALNDSVNNTSTTTATITTAAANTITSSIFPKIPTLTDNNNVNTNGNGSNNGAGTKLKSVDSSSNLTNLEKPSVPPPTIPSKPPPIGFNISLNHVNTSASEAATSTPVANSTKRNNTSISSSSEISSPTSTLQKPPKPAIPRKPTVPPGATANNTNSNTNSTNILNDLTSSIISSGNLTSNNNQSDDDTTVGSDNTSSEKEMLAVTHAASDSNENLNKISTEVTSL